MDINSKTINLPVRLELLPGVSGWSTESVNMVGGWRARGGKGALLQCCCSSPQQSISHITIVITQDYTADKAIGLG
jgi:hypothetical protein